MPLSAVFSQTGIVAVARFDGAEMSDADNVFFNFCNAFRFPEYFGMELGCPIGLLARP